MIKYILVVIVVLMAIFFAISTNSDFNKSDVEKNKPFQRDERSDLEIVNNKSITSKQSEDNENATKPEDNSYISFAKCGVDGVAYLEKMDHLNDIDLTEPQIDQISKEMNMCENWFEKLELMEPSAAKSLIEKLEKEKELLISLATLKFNSNTLEKATTAIKSKDPYVGSLALNYLLQFDAEFSKKVADEMGVQNVNFLTSSDSFIFLYQCHQGMDCSSSSDMMQSLCQINPENCGMPYQSIIQSQITINQYDDMLHAINVINLVVDSDWFEDREFINLTDP